MTIGDLFKAVRLAKQWTQEEVGCRLGVGKAHVSAIEKGKRTNIYIGLVVKFAMATQTRIVIYPDGRICAEPESSLDTDRTGLLDESDINKIADRIAEKIRSSSTIRDQSYLTASMSLRNLLLSKLAQAGFDTSSAVGLLQATQRLAQASQIEEASDYEALAAVLRGDRHRLDDHILLMLVEGFSLLLNGDPVTFEQLVAAQTNNGTHTPNGHGCGIS